MLATLGNQSNGISFWFDCYKSDWETTDWSAYWLFGWVRRLGGGGLRGGRGTGQATEGTEFLRWFFSKDSSVKKKKKRNSELGRIWKQLTKVRSNISTAVMWAKGFAYSIMCVSMSVSVSVSLCDNLNELKGRGQSICYSKTGKDGNLFFYTEDKFESDGLSVHFTTESTPTLNEPLLYTRVLTLQLLWLASCAFQGWIHVVPCHPCTYSDQLWCEIVFPLNIFKKTRTHWMHLRP